MRRQERPEGYPCRYTYTQNAVNGKEVCRTFHRITHPAHLYIQECYYTARRQHTAYYPLQQSAQAPRHRF